MASTLRRRTAWIIPALLVTLSACGRPTPGTAPTDVRLSDTVIETGDTTLALSSWTAPNPRAIVIGLHGFGDYAASTFRFAAPVWATRGITTYAYDQRGFGRNETAKSWPGADKLAADLGGVFAQVKARHPGLPIFVIGHSMGGGVVLLAAGTDHLKGAEGLVLLSPATWGADTLPVSYRASAWLAAQVLPDQRWTGEGVVQIRPTDNIDLLREMSGDANIFYTPSSREFLGLVRLSDAALLASQKVDTPSLFVWGELDEVIPREPVARAYDNVPAAKDFVDVPTGWHLLLRDLEAERVHKLVADWILR